MVAELNAANDSVRAKISRLAEALGKGVDCPTQAHIRRRCERYPHYPLALAAPEFALGLIMRLSHAIEQAEEEKGTTKEDAKARNEAAKMAETLAAQTSSGLPLGAVYLRPREGASSETLPADLGEPRLLRRALRRSMRRPSEVHCTLQPHDAQYEESIRTDGNDTCAPPFAYLPWPVGPNGVPSRPSQPELSAREWVRRHGSGVLAVMRHRGINEKALDSVRLAHGENDPYVYVLNACDVRWGHGPHGEAVPDATYVINGCTFVHSARPRSKAAFLKADELERRAKEDAPAVRILAIMFLGIASGAWSETPNAALELASFARDREAVHKMIASGTVRSGLFCADASERYALEIGGMTQSPYPHVPDGRLNGLKPPGSDARIFGHLWLEGSQFGTLRCCAATATDKAPTSRSACLPVVATALLANAPDHDGVFILNLHRGEDVNRAAFDKKIEDVAGADNVHAVVRARCDITVSGNLTYDFPNALAIAHVSPAAGTTGAGEGSLSRFHFGALAGAPVIPSTAGRCFRVPELGRHPFFAMMLLKKLLLSTARIARLSAEHASGDSVPCGGTRLLILYTMLVPTGVTEDLARSLPALEYRNASTRAGDPGYGRGPCPQECSLPSRCLQQFKTNRHLPWGCPSGASPPPSAEWMRTGLPIIPNQMKNGHVLGSAMLEAVHCLLGRRTARAASPLRGVTTLILRCAAQLSAEALARWHQQPSEAQQPLEAVLSEVFGKDDHTLRNMVAPMGAACPLPMSMTSFTEMVGALAPNREELAASMLDPNRGALFTPIQPINLDHAGFEKGRGPVIPRICVRVEAPAGANTRAGPSGHGAAPSARAAEAAPDAAAGRAKRRRTEADEDKGKRPAAAAAHGGGGAPPRRSLRQRKAKEAMRAALDDASDSTRSAFARPSTDGSSASVPRAASADGECAEDAGAAGSVFLRTTGAYAHFRFVDGHEPQSTLIVFSDGTRSPPRPPGEASCAVVRVRECRGFAIALTPCTFDANTREWRAFSTVLYDVAHIVSQDRGCWSAAEVGVDAALGALARWALSETPASLADEGRFSSYRPRELRDLLASDTVARNDAVHCQESTDPYSKRATGHTKIRRLACTRDVFKMARYAQVAGTVLPAYFVREFPPGLALAAWMHWRVKDHLQHPE